MASTYSTNLKIELMGTGDQSGAWGNTTNTNLGTALEQAIVGYGNPNYASDANLTLTLTDSNASQAARCFVLNVTSGVALTTTRELVVPTIQKPYIIRNNTTGSQSITVKTSAGTGVTVPNGKYAFVYADGTNVVSAIDHIPSLTLGSPLGTASGGSGSSSAALTSTSFTMATSRLIGRTTAGTGAVEEISVGSGLTLSGGNLVAVFTAFPGVKQGLTLSNNSGDATNDIDVATGKAVDTTSAVVMTLGSTMVKRLDADWAPGTNQGGRYSGAVIANTTYHVWLVAKAAGADVDVYMDPSADAATVLGHLQAESGGADYLYLWRIGSILRESAAIVPFDQKGDLFMRKTPVLDVGSSATGTSAVLRTMSLPAGVKVEAQFYMNVRNTSGVSDNCICYLSDPDVNDQVPAITASPGSSGGDGTLLDARIASLPGVYCNTSRQIRSRMGATGASITLYIVTKGWRDPAIYRS